MSPASRTIKFLEAIGWQVGTVERYSSFIKRRFDLFNFIDLVGMTYPHPPYGLVAIQVTSGSNHADRRSKILEDPEVSANAIRWLRCGGHIWVMSWSKLKNGKKRATWQPRIEIITEDLFAHGEPARGIAASK